MYAPSMAVQRFARGFCREEAVPSIKTRTDGRPYTTPHALGTWRSLKCSAVNTADNVSSRMRTARQNEKWRAETVTVAEPIHWPRMTGTRLPFDIKIHSQTINGPHCTLLLDLSRLTSLHIYWPQRQKRKQRTSKVASCFWLD